MLESKALLLRYGNLRDEDLSDDEMTGIFIDAPDHLFLNQAKQLQNDGCSLEEIRLKMKALRLGDTDIDQLLDELKVLSVNPSSFRSKK